MSWRRTHDHHSCSFPPQSSATTTNHTHSNVRRTTVHQTDRLSCHHRNLRPSKQPFEKIWQGEGDKNHTKAALCLQDVMATTPWPTRFAVPRASNENISLRQYYATSRHSGNNVNKFPDWSTARALHMQSSWLDARLIDSSGRQKAYKKRQHMSFGATLQFHGTQKIFNAIARHGKAERSRIDSDRQQRKTSPFSRRQPFLKNGKIWNAIRRQPAKTNNAYPRARRCSNNQTAETAEATSPHEPSRHHTTAGRSNNTSPRARRYSNNQAAETTEATSCHRTTAGRSPSASRREPGRHHTTAGRSPSASHCEPGRHHTTTDRSPSVSRREPGRHHTTTETGPQASPRDKWEATTVDHHPNQDPVDAPVNICGTPVGPARNNDDWSQHHPRSAH